MVAGVVRIPARFNGPPASGHGGYSAGVVAVALGEAPAAVSLRAPPPLDKDLDVVRVDGGIEVRDGSTLVATAEPAAPGQEPPAFVDPERAAASARPFDPHPFPTCYGCGPEREPGDGLRLFAGPVAGTDGLYADAWTPADASTEQVWAAMDCPSSAPAVVTGPTVLARLCIAIDAPPTVGEPHAIVARLVREDGRKVFTAMALYDASGARLAHGDALWIRLS